MDCLKVVRVRLSVKREYTQSVLICHLSRWMLLKVNKLVGIVYVYLRSCGLGWNAKLPGKGFLAYCSGSFLEFQCSLGEYHDLLFRRGA